MKTKYEDLDPILQKKIDILDALNTDKSGFLVLNKGIINVKELSDTNIKKIYSSDDIKLLEDHKYYSEQNYISAFDRSLLLTNDATVTSTLLNKLNPIQFFKSQFKYVKEFSSGNMLYLLNSIGVLYVVNTIDVNFNQYDILRILREKFIRTQLYVSDITHITSYEDKTLIVCRKYGVFLLEHDGECTCLTSEQNIDIAYELTNKNIICARKKRLTNNLFIINPDGKKIITYNQLSELNEYVLDVLVTKNMFYVIADSLGALHSSKIIHAFELDMACISYNNIDDKIPENKRDGNYLIKKSVIVNDTLYILATYHDKPCILKYTYDSDNCEYINLELNISYDDIYDFTIVNDYITIITDDKLYCFNNDKLEYNYHINQKYNNVICNKNDIFIVDSLNIYKINIPEHKLYSVVTLDLRFTKNINNIDIYFIANEKLIYKFFDLNTKAEIIPAFSSYFNGTNGLYKIYNNTADLCVQVTGLTPNSKISGVIVHTNNLYYRNGR